MKTPTLKQVQKHFKDAKIVRCLAEDKNIDITENILRDIHFGCPNYKYYWITIGGNKMRSTCLWGDDIGYAKIIETTNKSNKVTGVSPMKTILKDIDVSLNTVLKTLHNQRPITKHKHTQGEWRIINAAMTTCVESGDKSICTLTSGLSEINKHNAKLIRIAPQLLQIAEMYFDSMKGTDAEGSIPFNLTLETLNKLK